MKKIGLALSGGGIKGAAHIGVLKAFEENNIKIHCISGTSAGSIVASLYACGYKADEIYDLFKKYCNVIVSFNSSPILKSIKSIVTKGNLPYGFIDGEKIEYIINKACSKKKIHNINQIQMPLAIETVDITDGTLVICLSKPVRAYIDEKIAYIDNINVGKAVRASSSFPVIFNMCKFLDYYLVDGGMRDNIPVEILYSMGAEYTIASCFEEDEEKTVPDNLFEGIFRSIEIMGFQMSSQKLKKADYILSTKINNTKLLDISKLEYCYKLGYQNAISQIKRIG